MEGGNRFPMILLLIVALIAAVIGYRYYEYIVNQNFIIEVNTACDPSFEQCFVSDCSPADDLSCPNGPYKKIQIRDFDAPKCLEEHQCTDFVCDGIDSCNTTYCSSDVLEEGESCVDISSP